MKVNDLEEDPGVIEIAENPEIEIESDDLEFK